MSHSPLRLLHGACCGNALRCLSQAKPVDATAPAMQDTNGVTHPPGAAEPVAAQQAPLQPTIAPPPPLAPPPPPVLPQTSTSSAHATQQKEAEGQFTATPLGAPVTEETPPANVPAMAATATDATTESQPQPTAPDASFFANDGNFLEKMKALQSNPGAKPSLTAEAAEVRFHARCYPLSAM